MMKNITLSPILFLLLAVFVSSCSSFSGVDSARYRAMEIAHKANFIPHTFKTHDFDVFTFRKIKDINDLVLRIYIEGDGLAWLDKYTPSPNPTPNTPLVLGLAAVDPAVNVAYIARPCQYTKQKCSQKYWMGSRYSSEIINAIDETITALKPSNGFKIELVGFSGGANIAAIIASQRDDIVNLRSIAGNLDHQYHTTLHNISPLNQSLNAADFASKLSHLPQVHFAGEKDTNVSIDVIKSYQRALSNQRCSKIYIAQGATHSTGWIHQWQQLLQIKPKCLIR